MEDQGKRKKIAYKHKSGHEKRKQALRVSLKEAAADPKQKSIFQLLQRKELAAR